MNGFFALARTPEVVARAFKVALVVGTILTLINQGDRLIAGIRRTRAILVNLGWLTRDHYVGPHAEIAAADHQHDHRLSGTPCPGPLWENKVWWSKLSAPLTDLELGIEAPEDSDMTDEQCAELVAALLELQVERPYIAVPTGDWATSSMPHLLVDGVRVRRAVNTDGINVPLHDSAFDRPADK